MQESRSNSPFHLVDEPDAPAMDRSDALPIDQSDALARRRAEKLAHGELRKNEPGQPTHTSSVMLGAGRTLTVGSNGNVSADDASANCDVIEIRDADGRVEMRIQITDAGPVLRLDGVRLSLHAADAIEMQCKTFSVDASESVQLASRGTIRVCAEDKLDIESPDSVHVRGDRLYLNCDPDFTP